MVSIVGYRIVEVLYESSRSLVYRAKRDVYSEGEHAQTPVILKILKQEYPSPEAIAQFRREYNITCNLNLEGVVKAYGLEPYQHSLVMVLEDVGGESLSQQMSRQKFTLEGFLRTAIQITEILGKIHQHHVIHKDINPSNIVLNPTTDQIKIIDFGIATVLSRETPTLRNPDVIEGTLAYLSPEQTGRMNRAIDYRTDFYSLGVTFYQLLCDRLPFETSDVMGLVHGHIARQPTLPHEINPSIPQAVSAIVMKLLAKMAEDRYQSAWGIKADLQICLAQLQEQGTIEAFALGSQDVFDKFQLPQKLYGREKEIEKLLDAYDRVSQGQREIVFVSGYSGIGKTALVQELYKPITRQSGYFISGKFDQLQRDTPYQPLIQALQKLIQQLLSESETQLAIWREKLLAALGENGQILIDVIPEVELLIGKQPVITELPAIEAQNRFHRVFQNFIRVFAQAEHPLVIFLDDLQWADSASLKFLQSLVNAPNVQHLLLIIAYRNNEVSLTHPFTSALNEMYQSGAIISQIMLSPLDLTHIHELITDTLHSKLTNTLFLAELVYQKTRGNPFFVNEFLKSLYQASLFEFDYNHQHWQFDLDQIREQAITDNVVELMTEKLQRLSPRSQNIVKLAACIGNQFDLETLAIVNERSLSETAGELWEAVQEDLIQPIGQLYEFVHNAQQAITHGLAPTYKFLHDRVQQAAYDLIPDDRKPFIHLKIGQLLLANSPEVEWEESLFKIVNHLNLGRALFDQRDRLAHLNLAAGRKAKASVAYKTALHYFQIGQELLNNAAWIEDYELAFALTLELAEAEFLCGNFEAMEQNCQVLLQQAQTRLDKVKVYELQMLQCESLSHYTEALRIGREGLALFDVSFPDQPDEQAIALDRELEAIQMLIGDRAIDTLIELPILQDPERKAVMKLLVNLHTQCYLSGEKLLTLLNTVTMVRLSLIYGNTEESAHAYLLHAMHIGQVRGDYKAAYEFGVLALRLNDRLYDPRLRAKILMNFGWAVCIWRKPFKDSFAYLREAFRLGNETGLFADAGYALFDECIHTLLAGNNLADLQAICKINVEFLQQAKMDSFVDAACIVRQWGLAWQGLTTHPISLSDATFDETAYEHIHQDHSLFMMFYWVAKLTLLYTFGDYQAANEAAVIAAQAIQDYPGTIWDNLRVFYHALTLIALYPSLPATEQEQTWKQLSILDNRIQHWADHCPENFLHQSLLITAEMAALHGNDAEAIDHYEKAIRATEANELIPNTALANELYAKFWRHRQNEKISNLYVNEAHYCYLQWGATAKVQQLAAQHPQLFTKRHSPQSSLLLNTTETTGRSTLILDFAAVMKVASTIAEEIVLDQLLAKLMQILLENAGAEKGYLILNNQGKLWIEAEGTANPTHSIVLQPVSIDSEIARSRVSISIINYVARTQESVVLNDATHESRFSRDAYILAHQPKSILCTPLLHQGKISGVLYVENNLTIDAFTNERLEVLRLLSTQAAIALENARLYNQLEIRVQERTLELTQANQQLEKLTLELQRSNQELEQFAYIASHDLQEPLRAITSYTQMLAKRYQGKLDSKADTYIGFAVDGATRMQQLIKDLLAYSRAGRQELKLRPTACNAVLQKVLIDLQVAIAENQAQITADPLPTIAADSNQIALLFQNLISNAIKYRRQETPQIHISASANDGNWLFSVRDNGIGIEPEYCERIFGIFQRLHTSDEYAGTGLGLAISKRIIERHHGRVWVESTLGQGSTFYIELPASVEQHYE